MTTMPKNAEMVTLMESQILYNLNELNYLYSDLTKQDAKSMVTTIDSMKDLVSDMEDCAKVVACYGEESKNVLRVQRARAIMDNKLKPLRGTLTAVLNGNL